MNKKDSLVLRKINIVGWKSAVVKQYKINSIPHFLIYDKEGKLIREGFSVYKEILNWDK